ncbi:MAG: LamG domain-containing protein, partial [Candidatus ainarchaeum sp.]|nr:LamG domain-containing protein [Candidatus ainarchaeum sp.]
MIYNFNKKISISPLIAVILIILVASVLTGAILSWSKSSIKNSLSDSSQISNQSLNILECKDIYLKVESFTYYSDLNYFNLLVTNTSSYKLQNPQITILGIDSLGEDIRLTGNFNSSLDKGETKVFSTNSVDFYFSFQTHEVSDLNSDNISEITFVFQTCPTNILYFKDWDIIGAIVSGETTPVALFVLGLHYLFNEGSGTIVNDLSDNSLDGDLNSGFWQTNEVDINFLKLDNSYRDSLIVDANLNGLEDDSGYSYTFTNSGSVASINQNGEAMARDFDGVSDYLIINSPIKEDKYPLTVSFWINADSWTTNYYAAGDLYYSWLINKRDNGTDRCWQFMLSDGYPRVDMFNDAGDGIDGDLQSNQIITLEEWVHILLTTGGQTGDSAKIYQDGELVSEVTLTGDRHLSSREVVIGAAGWSFDLFNFDGDISDVKIWNKELSESEVKSVYNEQKSDYVTSNDSNS